MIIGCFDNEQVQVHKYDAKHKHKHKKKIVRVHRNDAKTVSFEV